MRICYFADGRYIHALRWMRFFAQRGHEMHLISFAQMSAQNIADMKEIGVKCHGTIDGFHTKRFWKTFSNLRRVKKILNQEKIDILHCHFMSVNTWYSFLSGFHPYIITIMGGGDVTGQTWKPQGNIVSRSLTKLSLKNADLITSWSHLMADVVRPYCNKATRIEVIHGGIHIENFVPGEKSASLLSDLNIPQKAKVIFSPRLFRPLSNIHQIASAAKTICDAFPETYFLIAFPATLVDKDYSDQVKAIFGDLPCADRVRYIGEIPHEEIADYYRLADVTVSVPSIDGTPMSVLESMACGTPTVIGNLPDYDKEYFEHEKTTLMVDINDTRSIANGVIRFFEDDDLTDRITSEARKRVIETGSYETQMLKMEQLYKSLVKNE